MAVLLYIVLIQFAWSYGQARQTGGGAFSYSDSSGRQYSGSYDLKDGRVVHTTGDVDKVAFSDTALPGYGYEFDHGYQGADDFYPTYFSNLENILQDPFASPDWLSKMMKRNFFRAFYSNIENQRLAFNAARKAFDLSTNQGYFPNFASRLPEPAFRDFGRFGGGFPSFPNFHNYGMNHFPNSAFAGSAIGPGFRHQIAEINPPNPRSPNVNVNRISHYSDTPAGGNGYYAVSSKSYSSSANVNGNEVTRRGAETTVNNNGDVTSYKVES